MPRRWELSEATPNRLLVRIVRASAAAYRGGFSIYDGQEDGPDVRFDDAARPAYWARRACSMPLYFDARAYYIALLEKKAKFYEDRLLEFQDQQEGPHWKEQQAKAKAAEAAKEAEEAKAANEVKEAKAAEARRAQVEKRARLKADGDELRQMLGDTLQPVPSHKRKRTAVVSPPARKLWSLFG